MKWCLVLIVVLVRNQVQDVKPRIAKSRTKDSTTIWFTGRSYMCFIIERVIATVPPLASLLGIRNKCLLKLLFTQYLQCHWIRRLPTVCIYWKENVDLKDRASLNSYDLAVQTNELSSSFIDPVPHMTLSSFLSSMKRRIGTIISQVCHG